jgi:two-component system sensor histidine kinase BaeS
METLPPLLVDAARIRQVLHNLLSNALRHTPAGGVITITLRRHDHAMVELAVRDTGVGMEPHQLEMVFERFYRSDRSRSRDTGGTGLGLAIVKAIVEAHDGRVVAQSSGSGHGTIVALSLPQGAEVMD